MSTATRTRPISGAVAIRVPARDGKSIGSTPKAVPPDAWNKLASRTLPREWLKTHVMRNAKGRDAPWHKQDAPQQDGGHEEENNQIQGKAAAQDAAAADQADQPRSSLGDARHDQPCQSGAKH